MLGGAVNVFVLAMMPIAQRASPMIPVTLMTTSV